MSVRSEHRISVADGLALHVAEYEGEGAALLCLPGLTRNSRDFEPVAAYLAGRHRLICPDFRGRGRSDWDPQPERYQPLTYAADMWQLLDAFAVPKVMVLGTSLGGIVGMMMAMQQPERIAGLVLNDVGAFTPQAALLGIRRYLQQAGPVAGWQAAADSLRANFGAAFNGLSDAEWLAFARRLYRERDGRLVPDYDPALLGPFQSAGDLDLWPLFDALPDMPVLLLRGEHSEILSAEVCQQMRVRRPELICCEVPGRGHAPLLDEPAVRQAIMSFLATA